MDGGATSLTKRIEEGERKKKRTNKNIFILSRC
jgi:hypothetical protein